MEDSGGCEYEVRPCPFCGHPAELDFEQSSNRSNGTITFTIACENFNPEPNEICLNPSTKARWGNSDADKAGEAILLNIAIWNRRGNGP